MDWMMKTGSPLGRSCIYRLSKLLELTRYITCANAVPTPFQHRMNADLRRSAVQKRFDPPDKMMYTNL